MWNIYKGFQGVILLQKIKLSADQIQKHKFQLNREKGDYSLSPY